MLTVARAGVALLAVVLVGGSTVIWTLLAPLRCLEGCESSSWDLIPLTGGVALGAALTIGLVVRAIRSANLLRTLVEVATSVLLFWSVSLALLELVPTG